MVLRRRIQRRESQSRRKRTETGRTGVKLVGEDERVDKNGNRIRTGKASDKASKAFTKEFSDKFEKLANVTPVFYEMRNLFDLSVCMAYVKEQNFYGKADWDLGCLGNESKFPIETASIPTQVETAVNAIWRGSRLMTPLVVEYKSLHASSLRANRPKPIRSLLKPNQPHPSQAIWKQTSGGGTNTSLIQSGSR